MRVTAEEFKAARLALGLTQAQLAERLNCNARTIMRKEQGCRSFELDYFNEWRESHKPMIAEVEKIRAKVTQSTESRDADRAGKVTKRDLRVSRDKPAGSAGTVTSRRRARVSRDKSRSRSVTR